MSPGQNGLRATNKDGSISRQSIAKPTDGGFVELPPRSKATIFAEDVRGSGIPAARLDIGPNSRLGFDSRRCHGGHQTTGLGGGRLLSPSSLITAPFDGDGTFTPSTVYAAKDANSISPSHGFPKQDAFELLPPDLSSTDLRNMIVEQKRLIDALVLRVKEQADVVSKPVTSSGSESNDDVSQQHHCEHQAAAHSVMKSTSPEVLHNTATPMLVIQPTSYDGLRPSSSMWYNTMMETLSPWHAVLQQLAMVRPDLGAAGMLGIRAWTLIPAVLLLLLGKHTTWGWSWVQSKTYDPGGSCRCALPLRPDVAIMGGRTGGRRTVGGRAGGRRTMGGRAGGRPTMGGRAALLWGA